MPISGPVAVASVLELELKSSWQFKKNYLLMRYYKEGYRYFEGPTLVPSLIKQRILSTVFDGG